MDDKIFEEAPAKKKAENGTYGQIPHIILYGLQHIPTQDRWALASLFGLTWLSTGKTTKEREGPYKLSLREISNITGIQHASLRSKEGKAPRIGVLDRLQEIGYISFFDAKPMDQGVEGRKQTYLYIHLERIWKDNVAFVETWNKPMPKAALWGTYKEITVDVDNSSIVDDDTSTVDQDNNNVDVDNDIVDQDDVTVDNVSSNFPTESRSLQTFSKNIEDDPSLNQNLDMKPFLRLFMRRFLLDMGEVGNLMDKNLAHLQRIYYASGLDKESFRFNVENTIIKTKQMNGDMGYFYRCLCKVLHLELVN